MRNLNAVTFAGVLAGVAGAAVAAPDAAKLYTEHCASCHGADRLGAIGPALLPENLGRLKRDEAAATVRCYCCSAAKICFYRSQITSG